jgi:hypothetical protein
MHTPENAGERQFASGKHRPVDTRRRPGVIGGTSLAGSDGSQGDALRESAIKQLRYAAPRLTPWKPALTFLAYRVGQVWVWAVIRPLVMAVLRAWWSSSFCSAYRVAKRAIARSVRGADGRHQDHHLNHRQLNRRQTPLGPAILEG